MPINLARDDRGFEPNLPPVEAISHPKLAAAVQANADAKTALSQARQNAEHLRQTRPEAVAKDTTALADALDAGKPDPGTKHTAKADAAIAEADRHVEARKLGAERAYSAMKNAFAEHGDEWAQDLQARLVEKNGQWQTLSADLAACGGEIGQLRALLAFADGKRWHPAASGSGALPSLLAPLKDFAKPPAPRPELNLVEDVSARSRRPLGSGWLAGVSDARTVAD